MEGVDRIWHLYNNTFLLLLGQLEGEDPRDPAINSQVGILMRNSYFYVSKNSPFHSFMHPFTHLSINSSILDYTVSRVINLQENNVM